MKEDVSIADLFIERRSLFTTIHGLPHTIHTLELRSVTFETLDCLNTFIHGLHNRKIERLVVDNCVFTNTQLTRLLLMTEDLGVSSLSLTSMDIRTPLCEIISVFARHVSRLDLSSNAICSDGLRHILSIKSLRCLDLSYNPCLVGFTDWYKLFMGVPWLRLRGCFDGEIFSSFCDHMEGEEWESEMIDISDNQIDTYALARFVHISRNARIESLHANDNFIDDRVSDPLLRCSHIKNVYLDRNPRITAIGVEKLLARPVGHVSFRGCMVDESRLSQVETVNRVHRGDTSLLNKLRVNVGIERRLREFL